jgi:hypothetical protein
MKINKDKINITAIADGIVEIMNDEDKNIMSYGMINKPIVDALERQLGNVFDELIHKQYGCSVGDIDDIFAGYGSDCKRKFVNEISNDTCKKLYSSFAKKYKMHC